MGWVATQHAPPYHRWSRVSLISVARPAGDDKRYRVIDGMHRVQAVTELIDEGHLPKDFKLTGAVYCANLPEEVAVDYATRE